MYDTPVTIGSLNPLSLPRLSKLALRGRFTRTMYIFLSSLHAPCLTESIFVHKDGGTPVLDGTLVTSIPAQLRSLKIQVIDDLRANADALLEILRLAVNLEEIHVNIELRSCVYGALKDTLYYPRLSTFVCIGIDGEGYLDTEFTPREALFTDMY